MAHPQGVTGARPRPERDGPPLDDHFSWNRTVTVKTTGRGLPLMIIGS